MKTEKDLTPVWIETYTGKYVNPLEFAESDIDIEDIAHSLSLQCRYMGHCKVFYSVAEHSIQVARELCNRGASKKTCLGGLLHDASETYLGDIVSPLKYLLLYEKVIMYDRRITFQIRRKYDCLDVDWSLIKKIDSQMLATEAQVLSQSRGKDWKLTEQPIQGATISWRTFWEVEAEFLSMFIFYGGKR